MSRNVNAIINKLSPTQWKKVEARAAKLIAEEMARRQLHRGHGPRRVPSGEWLTTNEAAEYLKVKARTLLLWARQGKLKGYTLSGVKRHVWRFRKIDLDATLELPSVRPAEKMVQ